jgi:hypothetical protein
MADGSIIYEVRVDSSNVGGDLSTVRGLLEKGSSEISGLAAKTAQHFGKMLSDMFGNSASQAASSASSMRNLLEKSSGEVTGIASKMAQFFGKSFSNMFGDSASQAEKSLSRIGTSLNSLKNMASPVVNALSSITKELLNMASISLSDLGEVAGKSNSTQSGAKPPAQNTASKLSSIPIIGKFLPSFAVGTDYIPYDDFPALLHKGEAVLTASENAALKAAGGVSALGTAQPVVIRSGEGNSFSDDFNRRPVEVALKIGEYEFTQIIADTMNSLYRQWGASPLK